MSHWLLTENRVSLIIGILWIRIHFWIKILFAKWDFKRNFQPRCLYLILRFQNSVGNKIGVHPFLRIGNKGGREDGKFSGLDLTTMVRELNWKLGLGRTLLSSQRRKVQLELITAFQKGLSATSTTSSYRIRNYFSREIHLITVFKNHHEKSHFHLFGSKSIFGWKSLLG